MTFNLFGFTKFYKFIILLFLLPPFTGGVASNCNTACFNFVATTPKIV